ncbi:uncharacterized protein E5676_scaffold876G00090 [Cucumis melo var. makuwa]|uniref:Uncharacterized protein n=1 Tax=Cucumis melo var. makuwa TaxID=1194695 RepID=A0A5D3DT25_CUCMM|nr:uncharacterized protein E5676_scaffold876G00090 [Cucumis melo var. makuwa]
MTTAKEVWNALQNKYDTEEAGSKKYVVRGYLRYQMTGDKSVEAQSHEIQKIAYKIINEVLLLQYRPPWLCDDLLKGYSYP